MPLLAYNLTTSPLALTGVVPVTTLPASASAGARGPAFNVTGELKTLTAPQFAALQVQVAAGQVQYEWTGLPEFNTFTLVVGTAQEDVSDLPIDIYVDPTTGNDANPGTQAAPLATINAAFDRAPISWRNRVFINLAVGNYVLDRGNYPIGVNGRPGSIPFSIIGTPVDQLGGPQIIDAGSTGVSIISTVVTVTGALRGAYLRDLATGRRTLIRNNTFAGTQTTFSVFGIAGVVAGQTFVVERPGSVLQCPTASSAQVGSAGATLFMRDIKFAPLGVSGTPSVMLVVFGTWNIEALEIDGGADGREFDMPLAAKLIAQSQGSAPGPLNSALRSAAGLYIHTSRVAGMIWNTFDRSSHQGNYVMDNVNAAHVRSSQGQFLNIDAKKSNIFLQDSCAVNVLAGSLDGDLSGVGAVILVNDQSIVELGYGSGGISISNGFASGVKAQFGSFLDIARVSGTGNTTFGIVLATGSQATINGAGAGTTTVTGLISDTKIGVVNRTYAQLPFSETQLQTLNTGVAAAVGATNNITGLAGMTAANIGDQITINGVNAGTYLISRFVSATEVVVAAVLVADVGPLTWTLQSNRSTMNRI